MLLLPGPRPAPYAPQDLIQPTTALSLSPHARPARLVSLLLLWAVNNAPPVHPEASRRSLDYLPALSVPLATRKVSRAPHPAFSVAPATWLPVARLHAVHAIWGLTPQPTSVLPASPAPADAITQGAVRRLVRHARSADTLRIRACQLVWPAVRALLPQPREPRDVVSALAFPPPRSLPVPAMPDTSLWCCRTSLSSASPVLAAPGAIRRA